MNKKLTTQKVTLIILLLIVIFSWIFIIKVDGASLNQVFNQKNLEHSQKFIQNLAGVNEEIPGYLDPELIKRNLSLAIQTLQMSIIAIGLSTIAMLITVIPAAKNIGDGSLLNQKSWYNKPLYHLIRITHIFSRAVPELVWAMIVIFIFKPGILPGAIALAIHNYGVLGKLCAEIIENIDTKPIKALASSGASSIQILFYGIIPMAMPKFMTYIIYRWEVILRTTIIVGFVGAGGLGMEFKLAMSYFKYSEITLIIILYLILVAFADIISDLTRKISN